MIAALVRAVLAIGGPSATTVNRAWGYSVIGFAAGSGMDAAGTYAQSGTMTPMQSLLAGTVAAAATPNFGSDEADWKHGDGWNRQSYAVGKAIEVPVGRALDPRGWWTPDWTSIGSGISKWNAPSSAPGVMGGIGSSVAQEPIGNTTKDQSQGIKK